MFEKEVKTSKPNLCCVLADALRWDVFAEANPTNILRLGRARKAYSCGNSTLPSVTAMLMNYPPIGVGRGYFVHSPKKENLKKGDAIVKKYTVFREIRRWMPRYFQEHGYVTIWESANAVPIRINADLDGAYGKYFTYWQEHLWKGEADEHGNLKYRETGEGTYHNRQVSTPQIIKDLDLLVDMHKDEPIFAVILLLDTHSPYHTGDGKTWLVDPSQPELNRQRQLKAIEYIDKAFPNFINIFSKTGRPTEFIFSADHGEIFGGPGWGHSSFRSRLPFTEELYAIPFLRGRIDDWSKIVVKSDRDEMSCPTCGSKDVRKRPEGWLCAVCGTLVKQDGKTGNIVRRRGGNKEKKVKQVKPVPLKVPEDAETPEDYWRWRFNAELGTGALNEAQVNWKWEQIARTLAPEGYLTNGEHQTIDARVLDVGCGDLYFWESSKALPPKGYIGLDFIKEIIDDNRIKTRAHKFKPGGRTWDTQYWEFIHAGAEDYVEGLESPAVFCIDVLYHILDSDKYLRVLDNLARYSTDLLLIHTWKRNPFYPEDTDGLYQKWWPPAMLKNALGSEFKLVHEADNPNKIGVFYGFKKR